MWLLAVTGGPGPGSVAADRPKLTHAQVKRAQLYDAGRRSHPYNRWPTCSASAVPPIYGHLDKTSPEIIGPLQRPSASAFAPDPVPLHLRPLSVAALARQ